MFITEGVAMGGNYQQKRFLEKPWNINFINSLKILGYTVCVINKAYLVTGVDKG